MTAASDEPPAPEVEGAPEKASEVSPVKEPAAVEAEDAPLAGFPNGSEFFSPHSSEDESRKTLEFASELFERGSKAIEEEDFAEAADCLSRALEIRAAHYGELASQCASSYYKYGCALLYKAQEEADPLGNVLSSSSRNSATSSSVKKEDSNDASAVSSSPATGDGQLPDASNIDEEGEGEEHGQRDQVVGEEGSEDEDEDLAEVDNDESDLDLAWKMLDIARAIVEKCPEHTMEKVNILSALGEVSMEREDFDTSLYDYRRALSILETLVEPDHRRVVELNFRICLVLEVGSKLGEAVPYCEKAVSLCKSSLQRLTEEVMRLKESTAAVPNEQNNSSILEKEEEIITISGLNGELERKLEDLQQAVINPKLIPSEYLKMASVRLMAGEKNVPETDARSTISLDSSQHGKISGHFDSPAGSTAAANGTVTHLGVVGRGVKRASIAPIAAEPPLKKSPMDPSDENAGSGTSDI